MGGMVVRARERKTINGNEAFFFITQKFHLKCKGKMNVLLPLLFKNMSLQEQHTLVYLSKLSQIILFRKQNTKQSLLSAHSLKYLLFT